MAGLDTDRILRAYLAHVGNTLRTNYFRQDGDIGRDTFLALKFDSRQIDVLAQPRPRFEIFVYSPRFEGVHLRLGSVARGGLRWSDRRPKIAYSKGNFRPRHDDVMVPVQLAPASWRCSYDGITEVLGNHAHDQQSGPSRARV